MSAQDIYDDAPIGSLIAWSDRSPQLPDRFTKRLSVWRTNNGGGRLIQKQGERGHGRGIGKVSIPACFTVHKGDYGAGGVIVMRIHRAFSLDSTLRFTMVERPAVGAVRVFDHAGEGAALLYLAANHADAKAWVIRHGYRDAVLEEVTADEVGAEFVEGRAA